MCVIICAVFNLMTGLVVNQATKAADTDHKLIIEEEVAKRMQSIDRLRHIFHDADITQTGAITWDELSEHLRDPAVRASFRVLGLEIWDLRHVFDFVEQDEGIDIDTFSHSCLRLG